MVDKPFRCGYVGIIGRPNVGKSTLINLLVNHKISITSNRPQTTRHRILGIKTTPLSQYVFVDTPGIHFDLTQAINKFMNKTALSVIADVDVILLMIDRLVWGGAEQVILDEIAKTAIPVIMVINKIDLIQDKQQLLPFIQELTKKYQFLHIVPVSAHTGEAMAELEALIFDCLPESPAFFPEDQITDKSERFIAAEIIREKLMRSLGQELPYAVTVEIEKLEKKPNIINISAIIWVERSGQKAIVIGSKGAQLKQIGSHARIDMENFFNQKVFLQLWVKIKKGWTNDERALRSLGYHDEL